MRALRLLTQIQDGGDDMLVIYAKLLVGYSFFFCVLHFVKWQKHRSATLKYTLLGPTHGHACL